MLDTSWVVPGAKGAIINTSGWNSRIVTDEVTVTKVGKRDVVTESEGYHGPVQRRFRLADLGEQRTTGYPDKLVPLDDPVLAAIRQQDAERYLEVSARSAVDAFIRSRNKETAQVAINALTAYVGGVED